MTNQIAANFDYGSDEAKAVAGVVDHMHRFWNRRMLDEFIAHEAAGEAELSGVAQRALDQITEERRAAG